jgi:hypothetical protein
MVARRIEGPAEANLRSLPPMDRELELSEADDGFELHDGETLVLDARPASFDLDVPEPPSMDRARAAAEHPIHEESTHLFPSCFTCGPDRAEGDGLRLFVGRVPDREILAGAWDPHPDLVDGADALPEEMIWAALDCPTIWAAFSVNRPASFPTDGLMVLARQRLEMLAPVPVGQTALVSAWRIERDGRKHLTAAAIHAPGGELLARAESLLVHVPKGR